MMRPFVVLLGCISLFAAIPAQAFDPARLGRMIEDTNFAGVVLVSRGDTVVYARAFGSVDPGANYAHILNARWRFASITKQIVATLVMQEVSAGRINLDASIATYWPAFPNEARDAITIRHLMQHLSGLPNPDATPITRIGLPAFYATDGAEIARADGYCAESVEAEAGSRYSYNNCDFIVLGAILERVTGESLSALIAERISPELRLFPAGGEHVAGFHFGEREPPFSLANYGAAGGLNGTVFDLWHFNRGLMTGALLDETARETMWDSTIDYGYAALGQWVLPVQLEGCEAPVRLVERHGGIGGVQARNFILPELDMTVIAFVNRSEAEFRFGQVWRNEGFAHDLLSRAACHWEEGPTENE